MFAPTALLQPGLQFSFKNYLSNYLLPIPTGINQKLYEIRPIIFFFSLKLTVTTKAQYAQEMLFVFSLAVLSYDWHTKIVCIYIIHCDVLIKCEITTTVKLINPFITSNSYLFYVAVRSFKIYSPSKFQIYQTYFWRWLLANQQKLGKWKQVKLNWPLAKEILLRVDLWFKKPIRRAACVSVFYTY